jgi:hypothetical protein
MMLHPTPPRRSGESGAQVDINCAAAVFGVSIQSIASAVTCHFQERVIGIPPAAANHRGGSMRLVSRLK